MNSAEGVKTVFCDIDGVIFYHSSDVTKTSSIDVKKYILAAVPEKFAEWAHKGYTIILMTGRPESLRKITEEQITKAGLFYNQLIMGLPRGTRVIINDKKPSAKENTALAISPSRNKGLIDINI